MKVALVMGSISDWPVVKQTASVLDDLKINYDKKIISAHRMPEHLQQFAKNAKDEHYQVIIAAAGGAAHLPGMLAANTLVPVIGVPVFTKSLHGVDSLLSIVQMPFGVPVATVAVGNSGAKNAGLLAAQMLGMNDDSIYQRLVSYRKNQSEEAIRSNEQLE
ncbi:phosphoribosylaminoimidazole carboxylase carboxyltransferase subunit [Apilactobacillus ozensis DSM 23829 = JCM 17196]|uniref:N5-carboxyaminoimidazole ribonucleotide mutase n=1 Tax=Apilactobacillus ozensis DSM 23829 = JCM 17196 TaxID=1423781 RepID=A0A0R2AVP3_9LACO|nr:5-(carboxyamino)imidazole ribonucleotide mutase [Apilactobacillus ozensis]KRM67929.1 phosphoribosylaminoimidazole carboxylase carboxyltransferase subunit [Apilactobacillus ozensis DSM 23829 = JCM 17196]